MPAQTTHGPVQLPQRVSEDDEAAWTLTAMKSNTWLMRPLRHVPHEGGNMGLKTGTAAERHADEA